MTERPADGVRGCFLYSPFDETFFFRVYSEGLDDNGHKKFTDYKVSADDVWVVVDDKSLALYEGDSNKLDYTSKVLGRTPDGAA